jgi:hypothetical protein
LPDKDLWGVVLAAGDGKRLQRYVRQLYGKELPKQYVNFIGPLAVRDVVWSDWGSEERILRTVQKLRPNRDAEPPRYHDRGEAWLQGAPGNRPA